MGTYVTHAELEHRLADVESDISKSSENASKTLNSQFSRQISEIKKDLTKKADQSPVDHLESVLSSFFGKDISATDQAIYASNQWFTWNPSAIAVTEGGVSILGAQIQFPWVKHIERLLGRESVDTKELKQTSDRHGERLGTLEGSVRELLHGQAHLAETARVSASGQAHEAERRSHDGRFKAENTERYRQTAEDLNRLTGELEQIRVRAEALERTIGTA
ncbi:hypothetical protein [Streptomyces hyaluromycini]|uniref:hypothetical protein n=1 Tax=Streptomyces hyaluromycini TaxID=1377993 RepID=UPI000B5C617D|nr:hypothetical protein [Streptomyces hyaluromycini]